MKGSEKLRNIMEEIEAHAVEFETSGVSDDYISVGWVKDIICRHMDDGWIPVGVRLPEEKINPVTQDFCEYQVTAKFGDATDVRHYKFERGHWWHGSGIVDAYVTAWRENPEPYQPERSRT